MIKFYQRELPTFWGKAFFNASLTATMPNSISARFRMEYTLFAPGRAWG
jgi:hypothetical protein